MSSERTGYSGSCLSRISGLVQTRKQGQYIRGYYSRVVFRRLAQQESGPFSRGPTKSSRSKAEAADKSERL